MTVWFAAAMLLVGTTASVADAQLLVENFDYAPGTPITANGWALQSVAGTNPITVTTTGLTYAGYAGSNIGNAASMTTSGEDDNRVLTRRRLPSPSTPLFSLI